ncbi:ABC-F family ATP-binding cassette domain-containing protein [Dysgonomonas sp. BGC7]|uniref:ABC-F family ATP-binding cassette domain-containing protein n=1 Tax=Dysgonomonas sp. BGC7 TaxID=1658008 RepID=UPI0006834AD0|nr:ABC-F family ATP-binding cassette domain-containing protein [Dysgonomonas sp. BGC7]MBD8388222.1 ABC-F family ATP-binding cassette domain-containing protein [Dysgonomonas sp. BGC7]
MGITVNSLSYIHPDRESLFSNISFAIEQGQKASLVGDNGTGKSTLLRIIAGQLSPSAGDIIMSDMPYYIPQHLLQYDTYTIAQALQVETKLVAFYAILGGDDSEQAYINLDDDWEIESRVETALTHWGLPHLDVLKPMGTLSGGEKTKVFLSGIDIHQPGIVLLDEPSNHLDIASRDILYDFVSKSKATTLIVSHDRSLLNMLDYTLELRANAVEPYGGNYDFYKEQKEMALNALHNQLSESEKALKQMKQKAREVAEQRQKSESKGRRQGKSGGMARIVAGGLKRKSEESTAKLKSIHEERMEDVSANLTAIREQIKKETLLKIDLRDSELHTGKILIDAKSVNFSYSEQPIWNKPLSLQIRSGDRLRIEGKNGTGKTTLIKLLLGKLQPTEGEILRAAFEYLYIDQEYSLINNHLTVFEQVQQYNDRHLPEHDLKMLLHYHQFTHDLWNRQCGQLSGGEKMKLLLCCLSVRNNMPDMLILDEPTNNLDVRSQETLTEAIKSFRGSVIIISHDRYFIEEARTGSSIVLE